MNIGVLSDTHNFLDPQIAQRFAGVDRILHAGDVGNLSILSELETLAPVTAVSGNTDIGLPLPETAIVKLAGRKFLLRHIVHPPALTDELKDRLAREQPDAVIFGHTHQPFCQMLDGILFLNPGFAGRPKYGWERRVAILHCTANEIRAEFLTL